MLQQLVSAGHHTSARADQRQRSLNCIRRRMLSRLTCKRVSHERLVSAPHSLTELMSPTHRLRYTISLQAVLAAGDQVQSVMLAGAITNDTGERPVVAYLFGVEAIGLTNQSSLGLVSLLLTLPCPLCPILGRGRAPSLGRARQWLSLLCKDCTDAKPFQAMVAVFT